MSNDYKYQAGDVIATIKPVFYRVKDSFKAIACDCCFENTKPLDLKRCAGCRTMFYCDDICQREHWKIHKHECSWINSNPENEISEKRFIRFIKVNPLAKQEYPSVDDPSIKVKFADVVIDRASVKCEHNSETHRTLATFDNKCLHVTPRGVIPVGYGLYVPFLLLKSSCCPNSFYVFDKTTLVLRAARKISHKEPITIRPDNMESEALAKSTLYDLLTNAGCQICENSPTEKCEPFKKFSIKFGKLQDQLQKCFAEFPGLTEVAKENCTQLSNSKSLVVITEQFYKAFQSIGLEVHPSLTMIYMDALSNMRKFHRGKQVQKGRFYEHSREAMIKTYGEDSDTVKVFLKRLDYYFEQKPSQSPEQFGKQKTQQ